MDDQLLVDLWKALRIENPKLTKEDFARIAQRNYYQKGVPPDVPTTTILTGSIVRHLNRLLKLPWSLPTVTEVVTATSTAAVPTYLSDLEAPG